MKVDGHEVTIRYRAGSEYGEDISPEKAVTTLQGTHIDHHAEHTVHVTAVWAHNWGEQVGTRRVVNHNYGEPVFGFDVEVHGRGTKYVSLKDAEVHWSSVGSQSVENATVFASLVTLAVQLAKDANAQSACPACQAKADVYAARMAEYENAASE